MPDYLLPDVGEGLIEAEIVSWKVKVGDVIDVNDVVVEIETAKSLVELPSPYAGEVTALLAAEGETVAVGTPIIRIGADAPVAGAVAEDPTPPDAPVEDMVIDLSNPAASGGGEGESLVGRNKADRGPTRRARKVASGALAAHIQTQASFETGLASPLVEAAEPEEAVPARSAAPEPVSSAAPVSPVTPASAAAPASPAATRALAKPPVRKLAKDLGVDLASCPASGPHGTVTRADVEAAAAGSGSPTAVEEGGRARPETRQAGERETREPIKGVRKMMAGAMVQSAFTAPHVTEWITVDATGTVELVERLKQRRELRDVRISPLLVLAKAVLLAVRRTPEINSFWDEAAQEVVLKHYVNLGIAAATPRGLVVPNVKDADQLSLVELAEALGALTATAREGRTQPAEMAGGTFTITNVGVFGVDAGTPIINPGESAILCFGAIRKQPWVVTRDGVDEIAVRHVTTLALSFDHRHIDGEKGSRFLADVAGILEDPASALLF
jgi:2-oxoisovalerate dehydrogenase E2 component (dihydrolipoyl transacylase)